MSMSDDELFKRGISQIQDKKIERVVGRGKNTKPIESLEYGSQ